jgi:hypothetical protein
MAATASSEADIFCPRLMILTKGFIPMTISALLNDFNFGFYLYNA